MKNITHLPSNPEKHFIVTKNDINNNNALLPNILYATMESFATNIVNDNPEISNASPRLYKLQILKNAFLADKLRIQSNIIKYSNTELQLSVVVKRKEKNNLSTICKAIFKFNHKSNFPKAS